MKDRGSHNEEKFDRSSQIVCVDNKINKERNHDENNTIYTKF